MIMYMLSRSQLYFPIYPILKLAERCQLPRKLHTIPFTQPSTIFNLLPTITRQPLPFTMVAASVYTSSHHFIATMVATSLESQ